VKKFWSILLWIVAAAICVALIYFAARAAGRAAPLPARSAVTVQDGRVGLLTQGTGSSAPGFFRIVDDLAMKWIGSSLAG
jgi:hypothetical protein